MAGLVALAGRLERRSGVLALAKLANVGLGMTWGFIVTFVFVRLLPLGEFRTFLLLIAFANFTVSAELGLTSIAYSRLRRHRVSGEGMFRSAEIVALFWLMVAIILLGAGAIALALATGAIETRHPVLFIAFYGVSAINLLAVLARRALAALDHNIWWEAIDLVRRLAGIALLLAALGGLSILQSVLIQLVLSVGLLWLGMATVHGALVMTPGQWLALRAGASHVRAHYLADFGRTGALTLFDVAAYNAPYFTIAAATHDPRPLLIFDFAFKMSRALSAVIRALVEALLPAITRAWFKGDKPAFRAGLGRGFGLVMLVVAGAAAALALLGGLLVRILFDGHVAPSAGEIAAVILLLGGLGLICLSVYVQNGMGRFAALVGPSFAFLLGSLLSVPLALLLQRVAGWDFAPGFIGLYAAVHLVLAGVHGRMLLRLGREVPA